MFSIIIPLYNKSAYIEKAIQSVFAQTYQEFELIVVNDGSTDDGLTKVNLYLHSLLNPKSEIKLINQPNSGASTARNNGVKAAKYDYIAFLDADDWWESNFLEEMKSLVEKCNVAALFGSNYYYVKNGQNRLEDKGLPISFSSGYIDYISLYASEFVVPINCSFVVVRKNAFLAEGGFKASLKFGEDFDLWIRLATKYKVAYLNKPLAYSNQDVEKSNRSVGSQKIFSPNENVIFNLQYLEKQETETPELKILLDGLRVRALTNYYLKKLYRDSTKAELNKVDFSKQTFRYRFIYRWPRLMVQFYFNFMLYGSQFKQNIISIVPQLAK